MALVQSGSRCLKMSDLDAWECNRCGTSDKALRYPSGKMRKCMDCQRWYNITVNSKKERKHKPKPKLLLKESEFLTWCRSQQRACYYCGILEKDIRKVGLKTQTGKALAALGVDRIASELGYEEGNIVLCCFACNKAKGDVFGHSEMIEIGKTIAKVWKERLCQVKSDHEHICT